MAGIPSDILNDLCTRFLINLPDTERNDPIRVCFQAELAHWFYIDFYASDRQRYPFCKEMGVREFIRLIFYHVDFLNHYISEVDAIIDQWRKYKANVPTYGAILMDGSLEHVLLVQGYYAKNSWGFPKGKVNEDEDPWICACREVFEETGYTIQNFNRPPNYIDRQIGENLVRLYIVIGVPADFPFKPTTRNEIKKIQWFRLHDLPASKIDDRGNALGLYPNHFFTVIPFIDDMKRWVQKRRDRGTPTKMGAACAFRHNQSAPMLTGVLGKSRAYGSPPPQCGNFTSTTNNLSKICAVPGKPVFAADLEDKPKKKQSASGTGATNSTTVAAITPTTATTTATKTPGDQSQKMESRDKEEVEKPVLGPFQFWEIPLSKSWANPVIDWNAILKNL